MSAMFGTPPTPLKVPAYSPRRLVTGLALVAVLFGSLMVLTNCSTTVQPGNVGVRIRTLGTNAGVQQEPLPARWYLVGVGERIVQYPAIQRTYTYTREADQFGSDGNEEISFSDNNALPMTADVQVVMRVDPLAAPVLYTRYRLSFDQLFQGPIRNDIRSAIAAETELVPVEFLYRGGRQQVIQKALTRVQKKWSSQGVAISQVDWIGNIRYPQVILDSIQAKTKADADTIAAQARVAVAKAVAESKVEQARGEAEANRLLAQSISSSPEVVQLRAIEKWDGKLPTVTGGSVPFVDIRGK